MYDNLLYIKVPHFTLQENALQVSKSDTQNKNDHQLQPPF
jgi:hypothetical protein